MNTIENKPYLIAIEKMGITVKSVFVPFSKSRNKHEKHKSLNWKVTLCRNGQNIVTTDYTEGMAHCPAYKNAKSLKTSIYVNECVNLECERGVESDTFNALKPKKPILPETESVIYSLIMDSEVLNYSDFESWASNCGFDTDSRKAEKIYNDCLKIALQLKQGFTDTELESLRESFQDY